MKAVIAHKFGLPDTFVVEDVEATTPAPGAVRIRVHAAGVSFVDKLIAQGKYQVKPELPFCPGSELAGVVDMVGDNVVSLELGDRVCTSMVSGAFAERVNVSAESVYRIPVSMPFKDAAVFRVPYATVYHALVQRAALTRGDTVLVLGAGGSLGCAAIQVAKALGARVIAVASSEPKLQFAIAAGADEQINSVSAELRPAIKALTGGRGVDVVFDPVGGHLSESAFRSLAWGGRHLVVGFASGTIHALPANLALLKGASLVGVDIRQFEAYEAECARDNMKQLFALYELRMIRPAIGQIFQFNEFAKAMYVASDRQSLGRTLLTF